MRFLNFRQHGHNTARPNLLSMHRVDADSGSFRRCARQHHTASSRLRTVESQSVCDFGNDKRIISKSIIFLRKRRRRILIRVLIGVCTLVVVVFFRRPYFKSVRSRASVGRRRERSRFAMLRSEQQVRASRRAEAGEIRRVVVAAAGSKRVVIGSGHRFRRVVILNCVNNDVVMLLQPRDELHVADGVGQVADANVGRLAEQILALVRRVLHLKTDGDVARAAVVRVRGRVGGGAQGQVVAVFRTVF